MKSCRTTKGRFTACGGHRAAAGRRTITRHATRPWQHWVGPFDMKNLPRRLKHLGRLLPPLRLVHDHRIYTEASGEQTHLLTYAADGYQLIVARADLETLLHVGLLRIASNTPGMVSFYFTVPAAEAVAMPEGAR